MSSSLSNWPNHRLQATHKSARPVSFFQAVGAALLCAPEPKRYVAMEAVECSS